jgi:hypothetical protein
MKPRSLRVILVSVCLLVVSVLSWGQAAVGAPGYIEVGGRPADIVYDPGRHLLYVSMNGVASNFPFNNEIKVISTDTHSVVDTIHIPNPAGMDISPDGSVLLVSSAFNEYIRVLDLNTRKVIAQFTGFIGDFGPMIPSNISALKNGKAIVYASKPGLGSWFYGDYRTGQFTKLSVKAPISLTPTIVRSADGSKAFLNIDNLFFGSGGLAIFDADSGTVSATSSATGNLHFLTANAEGTRFAACCDGFNLYLFDPSLNKIGTYNYSSSTPTTTIYGLNFSRGGSSLYLQQVNSETSLQGFAPQVVTLDANTMTPTHTAASVLLTNNQSNNGQFFDSLSRPLAVDDQGRTYGLADHGVIVDYPGNAPPATFPAFLTDTFAPVLGAPGSTATLNAFLKNRTLVGVAFDSSQATVNSIVTPAQVPSSVVTVTAPGGPQGTVNVNVLFSDGWYSILPYAFSYSPSIQTILSTGGPTQGGNVIEIIGYGFGDNPSALHFSFGGPQGTVNSIVPLRNDYSIWPVITPYRSALVTVPSGIGPGPVDLTVTTPFGLQTLPQAYTYINAILVPHTGRLGSPIFDRFRNRAYFTNSFGANAGDRIEVFDVGSRSFLAPIITGPSIYHLGLSPDGQNLFTATSEKQILVINPDTANIRRFSTAVVGDDPNFNPGPFFIVGISNGRAVFANQLSGCQQVARLFDVTSGQVTLMDQTGLPCVGGDIYTTDDGSKVLFAQEGDTGSELNIWDFSTDTAFGRTTDGGIGVVSEGNLSGDGNRVASGPQIFGADLSTQAFITFDHEFQQISRALGTHLNPAGSLAYTPTATGFLIADTNTGHYFGLYDLLEDTVFGIHGSEALDPIGRHLFIITASGLTVAELPPDPLTIGWVNPPRVANGATALVRGSGFQPGASVKVSGVDAQVTFVDSATLQITVPTLNDGTYFVHVTNPDNSSYTLPSALTYTQSAGVPNIDSLSPSVAAVGDEVPFVNVAGTNFTPATQAYAGHHALVTDFISPTQLHVGMPANSYLKVGVIPVFAITTGPGGGCSNSADFNLQNPVPVIDFLDGSTRTLFQSSTGMTVTGRNVAPGAVVRVNGQDRVTNNFSSLGTLSVQLLPSDVTTPGTLQVTVFNPPPGGGVSNALTLPVQLALANPSFLQGVQDLGTRVLYSRISFSRNIQNLGQTNWNISDVDIPDNVTISHNCPGLQPGSFCSVTISFNPTRVGPWAGSVVFHGNVSGGATTIPLAANVVDLQLNFTRPTRTHRGRYGSCRADSHATDRPVHFWHFQRRRAHVVHGCACFVRVLSGAVGVQS